MRVALVIAGFVVAVGCASSNKGPADATDIPGHTPGMPGIGAHGVNFYRYRADSPSSIATPTMATQPSGSAIVVSIGRGDKQFFVLPTDNKGNAPYQQLGDVHNYLPYFPNSGTALYAFTSAKGGTDFQVTASTDPADEITVAAVEVVEGTRIQDFQWNELNNLPITSKSVTTTGPATLIAFWWGDAAAPGDQTATADNGFVVVDSVLFGGSLVQCAVAVKNVDTAGTYNVTWTATPEQGAQLWLVAVQ